MFLLVVSGMSKYTAYSSSGTNNEVFNKMPHTMKAILGIGSFDVTTISGFFALMFLYIELTAAIHATNYYRYFKAPRSLSERLNS
mgnify:CR=1 FL=1